jgi:hypothetical protein
VLSSLLLSGIYMTWFIAAPAAVKSDGAVPAASETAAAAAPGPVAMAGAAAEVAAAEAPRESSESLASLAAKMRSEIRDSLHRDIADSLKQIKDRTGRG